MNWQRARTDKQKRQRISEILDATTRLYARSDYDQISLAAIAREANFTRSNLYKYFQSKEEIFFEFLKHDVRLWRKDLVTAFEGTADCSVDAFATDWVAVLTRHERLLRLISVMYAHLEKKSSIEGLIDFKQMANDEYGILSDMLCRLFPALDPDGALKFMHLQLAMSIGLYTMTDLSETQQQVLDRPEFQHFKIEFASSFQEAVVSLMRGLLK